MDTQQLKELDRAQRKQFARDCLATFGQGQVLFAKALDVSQSAVTFWVASDRAYYATSPRLSNMEKMAKLIEESFTVFYSPV